MAAELIKSKIRLSIGILVSNRIGTIRNCMESLVPLLKSVPSELIALDTVGDATDGSIAVVKEYTDKVYPYVWCNDFADARNTCLKYASGEWFLFLDDDEWFDHVEDLVEFLQSEDRENYGYGIFHIRNYMASGNYNTTQATRMIRRREDTRFVGRIHECFHEVYPEGKQFSCFLHHNGYVFANEEEKKKHQKRNVSILKKELEEKGLSPRGCAQMVQELFSCDDTRKEGYEYSMSCLPELVKTKAMDSCTQWILVASVRYFHVVKDYDNLLQQIDKVSELAGLSQAAALALYGVWMHAAVEAKDYSRIPGLASDFVEMYDWLKNHPEECMVQTQLDFPKYQEEEFLEQVVQAGAIAANALGQYEAAHLLWKHMPWKRLKNQGQQYQAALLETLRGMSNKESLVAYYRSFYHEKCFAPVNRHCLPKECQDALIQAEMEK